MNKLDLLLFFSNKKSLFHFLLFMKLVIIFLFIGVFTLYADPAHSQSQRISLDCSNKKISDILNEIEKQTDYLFFYNHKEIKSENKASVNVSNMPVSQVLDKLFKDTDVKYAMLDNHIVLSTNISEGNAMKTQTAQQQDIQVHGVVRDSTGVPVTGAVVRIKGGSAGTITDAEGRFSIAVPDVQSTLVFSFLGYITQEIPVGAQRNFTVILKENLQLLEEVVVVGYGTQKKVNLTGAIATVNQEVFKPRAVTTTTQYLQGLVGNLNIVNYDGGPGQDASFNIRGYSGLGTSYQPLIIVDGFTSSLKELNPNDIESLTVLKDAASAAIYGAQAAYGVILITTKTGKKNTKPAITYTNNFSYQTPVTLPKTAGSIEFASLMKEASLNEGGTGIFSDETLARIDQYYHNPGSIPNTVPQAGNPTRWANWGDGQCNANEDWFHEMFKPQVNQMHNIEVTGGNENSTYLMSIGYMRDEGKLRYYDDHYSRYNANLKLSTDVNKWLTVGMNLRYIKENTIQPSYYFSSTVNSLFAWAAMMWPTQPVKDPNGHFTPDGRMAFINQANPNNAMGDKFTGTLTALVKITPDLTVNGGFTYNKYAFKQTSSKGLIYAWSVDNEPYLDGGSNPSNTQVWQTAQNDDYISSNVYATYTKKLGSHNLKAMAGTQMELQDTYSLWGNKMRLIFPTVPSISTAIGTSWVGDGLDHWSTLSYFGRLNYDYKQKYLIEFNIRQDGSSRYADKSVPGSPGRWGTFPSVSAGWNVARESFFAPLNNKINHY